ncbi:MAG: hypothetical protein JNL11_03675 [Bdellovibrionaceae bacterium]|nr:hypothetical protein [Pseudobdellovibrionaceae bacterium]
MVRTLFLCLFSSLLALAALAKPEPELTIKRIEDEKSFVVITYSEKLKIGDRFTIHSDRNQEILGLAELVSSQLSPAGYTENSFIVLKVFKDQIIFPGQYLKPMSLVGINPNYKGGTFLMIRSTGESISSRYKPLYTQGILVGDTAETLDKNEFMVSYLGQLYYGLYPRFTIGTAATVNAAGGLNFLGKYKIYSSPENTVSTLLTFTRVPNMTQSNLNLTFLWDSYSNDTMITHNFLSLAVLAYDNAAESTAIKSFGTSSIQTGYEFILNSWDRVLVGPNYNFEKKTIGGYLSYVSIWDRFTLHLSLNTIDIRSKNWSYEEGYYFFMDLYWRY